MKQLHAASTLEVGTRIWITNLTVCKDLFKENTEIRCSILFTLWNVILDFHKTPVKLHGCMIQ